MRSGNKLTVYRDRIKEARDNYFVEYLPADICIPLATLHLTFLNDSLDKREVAKLMEDEWAIWIKRYPVPLMVFAFAKTGSMIHLEELNGGSSFMGFLDPKTQKPVCRWGIVNDEELPETQLSEAYLDKVYYGIPFRTQAEVDENVSRRYRHQRLGIQIFKWVFLLIVVVPVLVEILSLGVPVLGYVISGVSILGGVYKVAKLAGWVKPTQSERIRAEKRRKMDHYYWHCERNPEGFARLRRENFNREASEETRKEFEALKDIGRSGQALDRR
jgi:hypothetical protein